MTKTRKVISSQENFQSTQLYGQGHRFILSLIETDIILIQWVVYIYLAQVTPGVTDTYQSNGISKIVIYNNNNYWNILFTSSSWLTSLTSFTVTDPWKVTLLSYFHRLRNLLVLKFGLYLVATSQLICFFLNLCLRGYSVQKTLIQISSFHAATMPWVWGSGTEWNALQVPEKQNKARTTVIANKHRIQNVPKCSKDLASY